ncbi:DUF484 domain-containing protein [Rhodosalinus halophilus]|uniref:DUF484 domain-containing protein n=1 Tax=Rhodosalinus halophilus TaxID=2259333 RepID=A0A365UCB5_9RHOB|nr:DUF484 family protein [Rhodosalinus halophilus]RBI86793.1 DUF484 domain-containing protein [Rhodosalinus halophilus]
MSSTALIDASLRARIISEPESILEDAEVMRALVAANERSMGANIVDMRGIAMERLEARLDRLEETHRSVIAAAYENLAGTNQVHRAILRMLDPVEFETFLDDLDGEVAAILRVDAIRLVLESAQAEQDPAVERLGGVLRVVEPGFVRRHVSARAGEEAVRPVTLRQIDAGEPRIYGDRAAELRSEACLRLDLGAGRLPGLLLMGAEDPHQFSPQHGTDLLTFFAGVFERAMRRWLA